jgi:hypothetical protein
MADRANEPNVPAGGGKNRANEPNVPADEGQNRANEPNKGRCTPEIATNEPIWPRVAGLGPRSSAEPGHPLISEEVAQNSDPVERVLA